MHQSMDCLRYINIIRCATGQQCYPPWVHIIQSDVAVSRIAFQATYRTPLCPVPWVYDVVCCGTDTTFHCQGRRMSADLLNAWTLTIVYTLIHDW